MGTQTKTPDLLILRDAIYADRKLLFQWANDPSVRKYSFHPEPISWEEHESWFDQMTGHKNQSRIYIANNKQQVPVGQIRFEKHGGEEAKISFSVGKDFRGQGIGTLLLKRGVIFIKNVWPSLGSVYGLVRHNNIASVKTFEKLGFTLSEENEEYRRFIYIF